MTPFAALLDPLAVALRRGWSSGSRSWLSIYLPTLRMDGRSGKVDNDISQDRLDPIRRICSELLPSKHKKIFSLRKQLYRLKLLARQHICFMPCNLTRLTDAIRSTPATFAVLLAREKARQTPRQNVTWSRSPIASPDIWLRGARKRYLSSVEDDTRHVRP